MVAILAADGAASFYSDVYDKLVASHLFSAVGQLGCSTGSCPTPALSSLTPYAALFVWSGSVTTYGFVDVAAVGNVLASYVDGGGRVVMCAFGFATAPFPFITGAFQSGGYNALTYASNIGNTGTTYSLNTGTMLSSPLLSGVSSFSGGTASYHSASSLNPNSVCVAYWTDGYCLVAYRTDKYAPLCLFSLADLIISSLSSSVPLPLQASGDAELLPPL